MIETHRDQTAYLDWIQKCHVCIKPESESLTEREGETDESKFLLSIPPDARVRYGHVGAELRRAQHCP